jgi:Na+-transporting methylmalonyl-CoA/oxaloacetate decarboxylase gamma subunit
VLCEKCRGTRELPAAGVALLIVGMSCVLAVLLLGVLPCACAGYEARRRRAVAEAEAAVMSECTFQPRINTHHKSRQERVAELLAQQQQR